MQRLSNLLCGCAVMAAVVTTPACKKDHQTPKPPVPTRTIEYRLYTEEDFSDDTHTITFTLFMRTAGNKVLFDSAIAPMLVKEVPNKAHQLVFRKTVPAGHENDDLVVGFPYKIKDVGESWYIDTCKAGQTLKIVEYSFK
jgi:hypothetical protein